MALPLGYRSRRISLIAMILLYIGAGVNHFLHPQFYLGLMPDYLPYQAELIYISGVFEIVLGLLLNFPNIRKVVAWLIIIMLIFFLPVHINMIVKNQNIHTMLFWIAVIRLPIQFVLVTWAYRLRNFQIIREK